MTSEEEKKEIRDSLAWIFNAILDEDRSGFIEKREANMIAKYTGDGRGIEEFWTEMLKMDTDGDGKISCDEYCTFMKDNKIFSKEQAQELKRVMSDKQNQHKALAAAATATVEDDLDTEDMEGNVVVAATVSATPVAKIDETRKKALEAKFKELDEDGSGTLTKAEIGEVLMLEEGDKILEELWKAADKDNDGSISWDEFVAASAAFEKAEVDAALDGLGDLP